MSIQKSIDAQKGFSKSSIYGPVYSWRVGWSLGVDLLLETSICSFNCIYCQLGDIQVKTHERKIYVPTEKVEEDLKRSDWQKADMITLSGNGEPTLALNLGEVIHFIKDYTHKPVMVLTNATLLKDPGVIRDLMAADIVACKLDAANDVILKRMNRPVEGISIESIVEGIEAFRKNYRGKLALQCMFMPANTEEIEELAKLVGRLQVDEVQLNTPKRPYPLEWIVDSRGNHGDPIVESRKLRTISQEKADEIEQLLRLRLDVPIISIYKKG